jgi:taurine dioxygenase
MTVATQADAVRIEPLDAAMGARVLGCDRPAPWDAEMAARINRAFLDYRVLIFPGGLMDADAMLAFARHFGEPFAELNRRNRMGDKPAVSVLDSTVLAGEVGGGDAYRARVKVRNDEWHTDQSFVERPALATVLHAHKMPSQGGDTWFCDTRAVYEALPEAMKARIDGLQAVHGYDTQRSPNRPAPLSAEEIAESPDVVHPLVRTHPETGKKGLYLNFNRLDRIVGMERAESDALLDELYAFARQPRFHYGHHWQVGEAVVWDNRCTMHRAIYDMPSGEPRVMLRVVTQGDRPR